MSEDYTGYESKEGEEMERKRQTEREKTPGWREMASEEGRRANAQRRKMLAKALREGDKKGAKLWGGAP